MKTSERLANRLREVGLLELSDRARQGEFSDFESPHAMPKMILLRELHRFPFPPARAITQEVANGDYDDTKEEADIWFQREGKSLFGPKEPA
jgi:hypothetical protein